MIRTWGDLQRETLQLMRSYTMNGRNLWDDSDNLDYFAGMPEAANWAMRDLAAAAAPLIRRLGLSLNPVPNMLGDGYGAFATAQSLGTEIVYQAFNPKTYYFEVDNPATIYLEAQGEGSGEWVTLDTLTSTARRWFTPFSGRVIDADGNSIDGPVRLRFEAGSAYGIRGVAFYALDFQDTAIPPFTRYDRYDLRALTAEQPGFEFMRLAPNAAVRQGADSYQNSDEFRVEGDGVLVFDHYATGQWDIYYYAYPTPITGLVKLGNDDNAIVVSEATPMDFQLELSPEALDLVPLYMASRLYTEEKPDLCSLYLEQYEVRKAELINWQNTTGRMELVSESGWV